jgi:hypothetical protein
MASIPCRQALRPRLRVAVHLQRYHTTQSRSRALRPHYRLWHRAHPATGACNVPDTPLVALPGGQLNWTGVEQTRPTAATGTQVVGEAGLRSIVGFAPPLDAVGLCSSAIQFLIAQATHGREVARGRLKCPDDVSIGAVSRSGLSGLRPQPSVCIFACQGASRAEAAAGSTTVLATWH